MIRQTTVTIYWQECDRCGKRSPEGYSKQEMLEAAGREGWVTRRAWNGADWVTRQFCPECAEEVAND